MNPSDEKSDRKFAAIIINLLSLPIGLTMKGLAVRKLWGWFAADQFGAPYITLLQAIGISMLFSMLAGSYRKPRGDEDPLDSATFMLTMAILWPLTALLLGWIVRSMM